MREEDLLQEIKRAAREKATELNLSHNQLTTLPSEITELTRLTRFDLSGNQLTALPLEITELTCLTELDLSDNQLTALPPEISKLTNLTTLYLWRNQLTNLPPEIGELTNLKTLDIWGNKLTALPPEIGELTNLTKINLRDNQLHIPPEILAKRHEPAIIINYYLQHETGQKKPLNEAKMLLVGQGSVGKTALVKRLLWDEFDPHEEKTEGIETEQRETMGRRPKHVGPGQIGRTAPFDGRRETRLARRAPIDLPAGPELELHAEAQGAFRLRFAACHEQPQARLLMIQPGAGRGHSLAGAGQP